MFNLNFDGSGTARLAPSLAAPIGQSHPQNRGEAMKATTIIPATNTAATEPINEDRFPLKRFEKGILKQRVCSVGATVVPIRLKTSCVKNAKGATKRKKPATIEA
jgi:hypothetical protein